MGNHLKGCGCPRCRAEMHTKVGSKTLKKIVRRIRRTNKQTLRQGDEPPPTQSVEYTG
jgi:hypothetical protein